VWCDDLDMGACAGVSSVVPNTAGLPTTEARVPTTWPAGGVKAVVPTRRSPHLQTRSALKRVEPHQPRVPDDVRNDASRPYPRSRAGDSVSDHVSIDPGLRSEEAIDTCHHGADITLDSSAVDEIEGFLTAEPRSGVRCSAGSVTAGNQ
jgi:hypothetical protein